MAFKPQPPFPKSRGDTIRSGDWNDLVTEVQALGDAKVDKAGDTMTGPLTIAGALGIGVAAAPEIPLRVQTGEADQSPILGLNTPNNEDFLSIFGGRSGNQLPFVAWKRGDLRFGTATSLSGGGLQGTVARQQLRHRRGARRSGRPCAGGSTDGGCVACESWPVCLLWGEHARSDPGGQLRDAAGLRRQRHWHDLSQFAENRAAAHQQRRQTGGAKQRQHRRRCSWEL